LLRIRGPTLCRSGPREVTDHDSRSLSMFESLVGVVCLTVLLFLIVGLTGRVLFGK
jgi:hypothetical protein